MKYFKKSDAIFTAIILSLIAVIMFFYIRDLYHSLFFADGIKVGTITFRENSPTRRHTSRLQWDILRKNMVVYESDLIRTGTGTQAYVTFDDDDSRLEIDEHTMIRLQRSAADTMGEVMQGSVNVISGTKEKTVEIGGKTITLAKNASIIVHNDTDNVNIEIIEGSATVENSDGSIVNVNAREEIQFTKGLPAIEVRPVSAALQTPQHGLRQFTGLPEYPVEFTWSTVVSESTLELSSTPDFNEIQSRLVKGADSLTNEKNKQYTTVLTVTPQTWYWRVRLNDGTISPVRRFKIGFVQQIKLITPANNSNIAFLETPPPVRFSWTAVDAASEYILQVSDTQDFTNLIVDKTVTTTSYKLDILTEGTYFWQILPIYRTATVEDPPETTVHSFTIAATDTPSPPALIAPASNALYRNKKDTGITFSWQEQREAVKYEVIFFQDEEDRTPIAIFQTDQPFIHFDKEDLPVPSKGNKLFWTIRWTDIRGRTSAEAPRRSLSPNAIFSKTSLIYPPNDFLADIEEVSKVSFSWKDLTTGSAVFMLARDKQFKEVVLETPVTKSSISGIDQPIGQYFWKVKIQDSAGLFISETVTNSFKIVPPLSAPTLLEPTQGVSKSVLINGNITVRWDKIEGAEFYELSIFDANGKSILYEPVFESTTVVLPIKTNADSHFEVNIQSHALASFEATRRTGEIQDYSVPYHVLLPAELVFPKDGEQLEGLTAFRSGVDFKWILGGMPEKNSVLLRRNGRIIKTTKHAQKNTARATRLLPGSYSWTVNASEQDINVSAPEYYRFQVMPIPEIPSVTFNTADMPLVADIDYFKKNRKLVCTWEALSQATHYSLKLFRRGDANPIIEKRKIVANSFEFSDLKKLSRGTFVWEIVPWNLEDAPALTRKGQASEYEFVIDLPVVKKIKPAQEGKYYGY